MSRKKTIHIDLIRHTTPDVAKGVCYGQSDIGLASTFEEEKAVVLQKTAGRYQKVFSSTLQRCYRLATALTTEEFATDDRLLELHFGEWELQEWNAIDQQRLGHWMENFTHHPPPGGESLQTVYDRADSFLQELAGQDLERVAVVTHAGVIRCMWAWVLDIPLKNVFRLQPFYGEVHQLHLHPDRDHCSIRAV